MFNSLKGDKLMAVKTKEDNVDLEQLSTETLIERMKAENPKLTGKLPDKRVAAIVRGALKALAGEVNSRDEGNLRIQGLGRINIRQVEVKKDEGSVISKRVVLNTAKVKAKS
tara:strand:- start:286 stop:621 length:336 start_codon:yes stop_codon:yes gene_type:complete